MRVYLKAFLPLLAAIAVWFLFATVIVKRCDGVGIGDPKTVYILVRDSSVLGYPEKSFEFVCYLEDASDAWKRSESYTKGSQGFFYFLGGPSGEVHHISIQCGNFQTFRWQAGDRLIVKAIGVVTPFSIILDNTGEQYSTADLIVPGIAPATNLKLHIIHH